MLPAVTDERSKLIVVGVHTAIGLLMITAGEGLTTIDIAEDVAEQPLTPVTVTVLFEVLFTLIDRVVSPVFHK